MFAQPSPYVVVHVAVSLDGATGGFEPDVAAFYELANAFDEDVALVGADTILAQEEALAGAPRPGPTAGAPLLAVVDSRGRVSAWEALRDCGHWSDVVALRAAETPEGAAPAPRELATEGECVRPRGGARRARPRGRPYRCGSTAAAP